MLNSTYDIDRKSNKREERAMQRFEIFDGVDYNFRFSTRGGELVFWEHKRRPVLFPSHQVLVDEEFKKRGGCPICFPFFGPPPIGMEDFSQHGWLREEQFKYWKSFASCGSTMVKFSSFATLPRKRQYPWHVNYEVSYKMFCHSLSMKLTVERLEDGTKEKTPINPAFHPYFPAGAVSIGDFSPSFSNEAYAKEIGEFGALDEIIIDTKWLRLQMGLDGFEWLYFWSGDPMEYMCVEPVARNPKTFNTPEGIMLEEGEKKEFTMKLTVLEVREDSL